MEHGSTGTVVNVPLNEVELKVVVAAMTDTIKLLESEMLVDQSDIEFLTHVLMKLTDKLLDIRKLNRRMYE